MSVLDVRVQVPPSVQKPYQTIRLFCFKYLTIKNKKKAHTKYELLIFNNLIILRRQ